MLAFFIISPESMLIYIPMKYLIFILLIFSVLACQDSKNIENTMTQYEEILKISNSFFEKELEKTSDYITLIAVQENMPKIARRVLERVKMTRQKCENIINRLNKVDDLNDLIIIQEDYEKWLDIKTEKWRLGLSPLFSGVCCFFEKL